VKTFAVAALGVVFVLGFALSPQVAHAQSTTSDSASSANQVVTTDASKQSAGQTSSLISDAITGGLSGGAGPGPLGGDQTGSIERRTLTGLSAGDETAPDIARRIGIWGQTTYSHVDRSEESLSLDGNLYVVAGGVDYLVSNRLILGLAVSGEALDLDTQFNDGTFEATGVTFAPYVGFELTDTWSVDLTVGYGLVNYDSSRNQGTAPVTGDFDAERAFSSANVTGRYELGNWRLVPRGSILVLNEEQDSYTESNGTVVPEATVDFGRLGAGGSIGYQIGPHLPFVRLRGEWDFNTPDSVLKANGQQSFVDEYGARIGGGYEFNDGGITFSAEGSYDTLMREDLDIWTGTLRLRYEF
jgi:hypothetical protein